MLICRKLSGFGWVRLCAYYRLEGSVKTTNKAPQQGKNGISAFQQKQTVRIGLSMSMVPKLQLYHYVIHKERVPKTFSFSSAAHSCPTGLFLCLNQNTFNLHNLYWFSLTLHKWRHGGEQKEWEAWLAASRTALASSICDRPARSQQRIFPQHTATLKIKRDMIAGNH